MVKGGIILGRRYEILSKIGAGGMADVYKGRDTTLDRFVAIKVLKKEYREDETFVKKFRSEAQAAAGIMNPNVVNVYDVGEDRGLYYIVMELVEGITLKDYIEKKGRLSHRETVSIAIQMCTGIGTAHAANIIHRDIKPQNIIISRDGKVKVTDFGIAKATTSTTISSNAMGSVHYTSPEQAKGRYSDAKSDIYSIGITLYEMVTGQLPFDGDSTVTVALKHIQEEITPPSRVTDGTPYSMEQIILKCTQKNIERRYASTSELIKDLKRSLVDPDGSFVFIPPQRDADTVFISDKELDNIKRSYNRGGRDDDEYDEYDEDDDDEYDDDEYDEDDYDDDDYKRVRGRRNRDNEVNPRMNSVMKILLGVVAVIILFIILFAAGKAAGAFKTADPGTSEKEAEQIKVPNVLGITEGEAQEALKKKGLGIKVVSREESKKYDEGFVCEQNPKADTKVKKNSTVEVIISTGLVGEQISIPQLTGMTEEEAQKTLAKAGFVNIASEYRFSSTVPAGDVIEVTPASGTMGTKETEIKLSVSKGTEQVILPKLEGKTEEEAKTELEGLGFAIGNITKEYSDRVEKGTVISQSLKYNTKYDKGTVVDFVVSDGKKPEEKVNVPDLSGLSFQEAYSLLESYGLVCVNGGEEESEIPIGQVSRWEPRGTEVTEGTTVKVWISKGMGNAQTIPQGGLERDRDKKDKDENE